MIKKLGSFHPGTPPGISLCDTCVAECKSECIDHYEMVKCPDYVKGKIQSHDLTQLQTKSDQAEPVRVPQYERD